MPAPISFARARPHPRSTALTSPWLFPAAHGRDQNPICAFHLQGDGNGAVGAGTEGETIVLGPAALILAAASAGSAPAPAPALSSASPWWEKITYSISGDGEQQSCRYESSLSGAESCDSDAKPGAALQQASASTAALTRITIERRFSPGAHPGSLSLESGDTLLGAKMMALAIDADGAVRSCDTVGTLGDVRSGYGCEELRAERFEASARREQSNVRQAFMTILIYGHEEQLT